MKVVCFDLDDTLYKEIDYLKSAYMEIARYATTIAKEGEAVACSAYLAMLDSYEKGENAFECLNDFLGIDLPIDDYLQIYRNHKPDIQLTDMVVETLSALKSEGHKLGLITDGRSVQQKNKIEALGLLRWFDVNDIIISEEFGNEKPSLTNYEFFMKKYPSCKDFTYIGDNTKKDFLAPNKLGWNTVCLLDDGRNIHKQDFSLPVSYLAKKNVKTIEEIIL